MTTEKTDEGAFEVLVPEALSVAWGPRATEGLNALQQGGYTPAQIISLRNAVRQWIQGSYANWQLNVPQRRSFHIKFHENVQAHRTAAMGGVDRVSVDTIEAD